jgi:hypothetical protein
MTHSAGRLLKVQNTSIQQSFDDLKKEIDLLRQSAVKYQKKPFKVRTIYTSDELEIYDALSFRFMKAIDLVLNFFRSLERYADAKESDTLRDRLLFIQKLRIIDDIDFWFEARELRGKIAHTYLPGQLKDIYEEIRKKTRTVDRCVKKLEKYLRNLENVEKPLFDK